MPFHGLSLLLLILIVVGIVAVVRFVFGSRIRGVHGRGHSAGLDILEERYAKCEVQRDQYLQKKRDLGG